MSAPLMISSVMMRMRVAACSRSRAVRRARQWRNRTGNRRSGRWADRSPCRLPRPSAFRNAERLAVADDHADDLMVRRHPARTNVFMPIRARQIWLLGPSGCSKAKAAAVFRGCPSPSRPGRPLFAEALDAPGVDELVHLFGLIGDLRVALAEMNDLDAELVGQVVELLRLGVVRDLLRLSAAELLVRQGLRAMSNSACLVKWLIRPGFAPWSSTAVGPGSLQLAIILRRSMCRQ